MTTLSTSVLLAVSSGFGMAVAPVVQYLGDGKRRPWLLPVAACGQTGLGLWSAAVVPAPWLPATLLLAWVLLSLALVDQIDLRLPDALTLPLAGAGLVFSSGTAEMLAHGLGGLIGYGALSALAAGYRVWRGRDGIGQGDAKLIAAAGAWMGWEALPSVVVLASATALSVVAASRLFLGGPSAHDPIPFGPPLCFAIWMVWLYGPLLA
ncbi:A24 family peptidase [Magnetospirillum sp. 15-1]|uniref:prepilin peptidase n=1 Tax=Magnetospirillum sp. 15-1 TaxID=1979370 RepID=UPI000BBCA460|nr:A24 family peptidase [Magnetospirillum sp. 15-1]